MGAKKEVSSLNRAKRIFLVNLLTFLIIVATAFFIFSDDSPAPVVIDSPPQAEQTNYTLADAAYIKGQMRALQTNPATLPEYQDNWVEKLARYELNGDPSFSEASQEAYEALVSEFMRGYKERYNERYDVQPAYDLGYQYGLKFDPEIHGFMPANTSTHHLLLRHKEQLVKTFVIKGDAEWMLFMNSFDLGFYEGYPKVEEGITTQSVTDKIKLFEE